MDDDDETILYQLFITFGIFSTLRTHIQHGAAKELTSFVRCDRLSKVSSVSCRISARPKLPQFNRVE